MYEIMPFLVVFRVAAIYIAIPLFAPFLQFPHQQTPEAQKYTFFIAPEKRVETWCATNNLWSLCFAYEIKGTITLKLVYMCYSKIRPFVCVSHLVQSIVMNI